MSQPSYRERFLADLEGLLAGGAPAAPAARLFAAAGRVARVACGDDEDERGLPERADALLDRARSAFARVAAGGDFASRGDLAVAASTGDLAATAPTGDVERWLASPRGPFASALSELDGLGALAAGIAELAPNAPAGRLLAGRVGELARAIGDRARAERRAMFEAGMAASALIAERGVHPEHDEALLALADVVGLQLTAALAGEPIDDEAWRVRATDRALAERLGALLARALERPAPLAIAPDMVELSAQGWRQAPMSSGDLVLHETSAEATAKAERVELLAGVWVRPLEGELEVETSSGGEAPCLLPLVGGEPGEPCPSREGHRAGQLVFSLTPEAEGYALVTGDRVALLRRR